MGAGPGRGRGWSRSPGGGQARPRIPCNPANALGHSLAKHDAMLGGIIQGNTSSAICSELHIIFALDK